jgi:hypothetical protein
MGRHKLRRQFQKLSGLYRIPRRVVGLRKSIRRQVSYRFSLPLLLGVSTMNTKLALSAIIAALMLTACAKQEAAAPAEAPAAEAPAAEAPPAEPTAEAPPADAPAGDAAAPAGEAPPPAQ